MLFRSADLERARGGAANAGGVDPTMFVLLDRLHGIERKLDGGEVGRRVTPPPMTPAADPATQVAKIVKDLGLLPAKQGDVVEKIVEHLPALKSVLEVLRPAPPADPIDALVKLQNAGLVPKARDEREREEESGPLGQLDTVLDLVDRLDGRLGRGGARAPGIGVEAVRIIGPPVVRVLDRGVDAFNNWINFRRERLYFEHGARRVPGRRGARPTPPASERIAPPAGTVQAELVDRKSVV